MTSSLVRTAVLALIPALAVLASCTLAPDHCLHMSDCGDGTTCVEGLCVGSTPPAQTLSTVADASSLPAADASTPVVAPIDAATVDASDASVAASTDGALTDAASD